MNVSEIVVGDELSGLSRETDLAHWNRYAAVNDEFVPIHMDDAAGRQAGQDGAFGMGNLQLAYLYNLVREWIGDKGDIVRLSCQFRAVNTRGMVVQAKGVVSAIRETDRAIEVDLDLWTQSADGTVLAPGSAIVHLDRPQNSTSDRTG